MGISYVYVPVSASTLKLLQEDPESAEALFYPDDDGGPEGEFDVDKAWHGLHYLLTGTADGGEPPIAWAILGDEELGADLGMGGSNFLTPEQVREVAAALADFTEDELRQNFNPEQMQAFGIYPDIIWMRDGQDALDYVMHHFRPLVEFYAQTAARGEGLVIYAT